MTNEPRATGGPIDPGKSYFIGEHGPELYVVPSRPIRVRVQVPASRWQALKYRLRHLPFLCWLPVRMEWKTRFVGRMHPWNHGDGWKISNEPEEH